MAMAESGIRTACADLRTGYLHPAGRSGQLLADEIDRLREEMTAMFLQEASLTAESVMAVSRELDLKINQYMNAMQSSKKKGR